MQLIKYITTIMLITFFILPSAFADEKEEWRPEALGKSDELPQCLEMIKECFVHSRPQKINCFFSTSTHAFCEGSTLGKVVFKRWSMAPERPADSDDARFSYGMKIIDQKCLDNFDGRLSGLLVKGNLSNTSLKGLQDSLTKCEKDLSNTLVRP